MALRREPKEFEPMSLDLSDKPTPKEGFGWQDKEVDDWNWMDFFNYFEYKYTEANSGKGHWYNRQQRNAKMKIIEQSYEYWGRSHFRAMIDWLFDHYREYPQWKDINIGLICGAHGWAKMVGEKTQQQTAIDNRWKS